MKGPLIINDGQMLEAAALEGLALACTFENQVSQYIADGRLIRVLDEWCLPWTRLTRQFRAFRAIVVSLIEQNRICRFVHCWAKMAFAKHGAKDGTSIPDGDHH
jgi:DNA-binding transcriptional LysR family regulator